jgi:hypothetical protein
LLGLGFELLNGGRGTANAGTGIQPTANGTLVLRSLRLDGRAVPVDWSAWTGVGGIAPHGATLRYGLTTDTPSAFRLRQPTDGLPVAAIVSPALARIAGPDRRLPFDVAGERVVLQVVGVAERFPGTTQPDFAIADEGVLSNALDARLAGLGAPSELWVNGPGPALAQPPYDLLSVTSRADVEARLRGDPLARGALIVLAGTALVALALAVVGLLLGLVADLRDEGGELFDLETQGADPRLLRRQIRLRALVVALVGAAGGIATGAVLAALVLGLVRVTANVAQPQPPLVLALDWRVLGLGAAAYAAVTAAAILGATWLGFRAPAAGRFREVGA